MKLLPKLQFTFAVSVYNCSAKASFCV